MRLVTGILAHVDAGKTTLSESILVLSGLKKSAGRVDHKDAFLDTHELEKERGITIFSKQARIPLEGLSLTLLDTPGHVDFSAEMERALSVMDCAILVISAPAGIQGHTMTVWRLLEEYKVPVFIFVNKMDQPGSDAGQILSQLQRRLSDDCVPFAHMAGEDFLFYTPKEEREGRSRLREAELEEIAMTDEGLMETLLEEGDLPRELIRERIAQRKLFPVCFGSALHSDGVGAFLDLLRCYAKEPVYGEDFGARVYKIARDEAGNRLTYMKITGGRLKVKDSLSARDGSWEEKADQLRLYSGDKYELAKEAGAGEVVAVTGLSRALAGEGLGSEKTRIRPVLAPVLNYKLILPSDVNLHKMLSDLRQLEEEEPQLHIVWDEHLKEIHVMLMGEVQTEILRRLIWDRFHVAADFSPGSIIYRETILAPVIGVGHFEPLRHYAEVHLLIEPGERGSGMTFFSACSEDLLARNWQRLIMTHLQEKEYIGVLTGSPVTDLTITLISGRAHQKHTEGGDFRQATYRAVRQGLRKAESVLLEPYYSFRAEVPPENVGRVMTDIQQMNGTVSAPESEGELMVLTGTCPVSRMRTYPQLLLGITSGRGQISCTLGGYAPCPDAESVIAEKGYDPDADLKNPCGSVFCAHGAGFIVPWDQVEDYMHLEEDEKEKAREYRPEPVPSKKSAPALGSEEEEKELMAIFERTFGPIKRRQEGMAVKRSFSREGTGSRRPRPKPAGEDYLLVDGCNMIFAWPDLKELADRDFNAAQGRLMDILSDYAGIRGGELILVFDAYKVPGHDREILDWHGIHVVYTKEAETADQYIEKTVHHLAKNHRVTVATSDGLEQVIILGAGAERLSAQGLKEEIGRARSEAIRDYHHEGTGVALIDQLPPDVAAWMEDIRLGRKKAEDI